MISNIICPHCQNEFNHRIQTAPVAYRCNAALSTGPKTIPELVKIVWGKDYYSLSDRMKESMHNRIKTMAYGKMVRAGYPRAKFDRTTQTYKLAGA